MTLSVMSLRALAKQSQNYPTLVNLALDVYFSKSQKNIIFLKISLAISWEFKKIFKNFFKNT